MSARLAGRELPVVETSRGTHVDRNDGHQRAIRCVAHGSLRRSLKANAQAGANGFAAQGRRRCPA